MKQSLGAKTIVLPTPVFIVGSYDSNGQPNIMTAAWAGICCSNPPCVAISLRQSTYTFGNIVKHQAFTINLPSKQHAAIADYVGMVSGRDRDKFKDCALTPVKSTLVDAPYVQEFPLVLECKLIHTLEIGLHTQFVGEILDVKIDDNLVKANDRLDIRKLAPFWYAPGNQEYYGGTTRLGNAFSLGKTIKFQ